VKGGKKKEEIIIYSPGASYLGSARLKRSVVSKKLKHEGQIGPDDSALACLKNSKTLQGKMKGLIRGNLS